jgi:hypothetical protein
MIGTAILEPTAEVVRRPPHRPKGSTIRKARRIRGEASRRLQEQIDKIEREYPSDTIERLRRAIKGEKIIERLMGCVLGTVELNPTQVAAAGILLRKVLPDLRSVELKTSLADRPTVIFAPRPCETAAEWQAEVARSEADRVLPQQIKEAA